MDPVEQAADLRKQWHNGDISWDTFSQKTLMLGKQPSRCNHEFTEASSRYGMTKFCVWCGLGGID